MPRERERALSVFQVVRASLAADRRDGIGFDKAWDRALAKLEPPRRGTAAYRAWRDEMEALRWAREAFKRAYRRNPPRKRERAMLTVMMD